MRFLVLLLLIVLIWAVTALPAVSEDIKDVEKPIVLSDVNDAGDSHSNAAERKARFIYGGWGYRPWGWGGGWHGGWGGGWGGGWRRPWGWGGGGWGGGWG